MFLNLCQEGNARLALAAPSSLFNNICIISWQTLRLQRNAIAVNDCVNMLCFNAGFIPTILTYFHAVFIPTILIGGLVILCVSYFTFVCATFNI